MRAFMSSVSNSESLGVRVCWKARARVWFVVFFLASISAFGQIQTTDEFIRVNTEFVTVPVSIMDRDGRYKTGLKKDDFKIFEDGVEQEVALFAPVEEPFTALLLLDISNSMRDYMATLARAVSVFTSQLRADDQIIVATYVDDTKIHIVVEPTKKKDFRKVIALESPIADSFTTTFNAVERGIKYMKDIKGRRAIILFSDGELYGKRASAKSNLRDAEEQEALIYTIRFGAYPTHQPGYADRMSEKDRFENIWNIGEKGGLGESEPIINKKDFAKLGESKRASKDLAKLMEKVNAYMQGLAQKTGGRSYAVNAIEDLEETFRLVAGEIGQQYTLGYYPAKPGKDGERRKISVKVNVPNVAVRSRNEVVYKKLIN